MARQFAVGIDIGTSHIKTVIAEEVMAGGKLLPKISGVGMAESKGLQHGYITNPKEVLESISVSVRTAEKAAGVKVKRAFVSVGGIGLGSVTGLGSVIISRADLEITSRDLSLAHDAAEASIPHTAVLNKKIINSIPVEYKVDGKVVWGRVEGLKGQKLEVKVLFITYLEHHLEDLIKTVEEVGIEVIDVVAAPIAASFVTLSKKQKKAGCILVNIGAETLSVAVFENGNPISLEIFPIGSTDITHDIALGLKVSLEEAESIKLGGMTRTAFSKKKLDEIVSARLSDCFELVEEHLKKIQRHALLPAGIILTGGGAGINGVKAFAEDVLELPAHIAEIHFGDEERNKIRDSVWSTAYGLAIFGFNADDEQHSVGGKSAGKLAKESLYGIRAFGRWFGQFLP
jgi:cell division protein FtsA